MAGSAKVREPIQSGAAVINGPGNTTGGIRIVAVDWFTDTLRIFRPRASTSGLPSGLQKPLKALAHLFMGDILAALQGVLTALYGLDETGFFFEVACQNVVHNSSGLRPCSAAECVSFVSSSPVSCTSMVRLLL
jgi:hypothetical protein